MLWNVRAVVAIVPDGWPAELQEKKLARQPWKISCMVPVVWLFVSYLPEPLTLVHVTFSLGGAVRMVCPPATVNETPAASICHPPADAPAGRANIAALTAASASRIFVCFMFSPF